MLTIDQFVQREVVQCVSSLVSTLAQGYGSADFQDDIRTDGGACLMSLAEQAFKLASPIDDWEEAALQAGYSPAGDVWLHKHDTMAFAPTYRDAQEACEQDGIELIRPDSESIVPLRNPHPCLSLREREDT